MTSSSRRARLVRLIARLLHVSSADTRQPVHSLSGRLMTRKMAEPNATLTLDSKHPYLRFRASMTIEHTIGSAGLAPGQAFRIAVAAVHERAESVSTRYSLTHHEMLRAELAAHLAERRSTVSNVVAWGDCAGIQVDPDDLAIVTEHERVCRRLQAARWENELHEYRMRYYELLLTNPLRASAWWLTSGQHFDKVTQLPQVATAFQQLRELLAPEAVQSTPQPDTAGLIVDEFFRTTEPPDQQMMCQVLTKMYQRYRRDDLAERNDQLATARGVDGTDESSGAAVMGS